MSQPAGSGALREFYPGMGQAVAERTILRKKEDGNWESWGDVAKRVAVGNVLLKDPDWDSHEFKLLHKHLRQASVIMSGRHLQHGDVTQPLRPKEVFTNCATAATSFFLFLLLLSGSGVGRCYDDDMIVVDWDNAPNLRCVLDEKHPDFDWSAHESSRDALHKYGRDSKKVRWFRVPDTREGWAQAIEVWEVMAFEKIHRDSMLILDFSDVRPKGAPIMGMQGRPASGPVPLMNAFAKSGSLKGAGLEPWKQAMYVDHYFGECVLVGGARRAARMSTKWWEDPGIFDFIHVKRPVEFDGLPMEEVVAYRKANPKTYGFLWSSNDSVTVDSEFWKLVNLKRKDKEFSTPHAKHARKVWAQLTRCAYADGTGEPGVINLDKLVFDREGFEELTKGDWAGSDQYRPMEDTEVYLKKLGRAASKKKYPYIVNPCGEIVLSVLGGYCVICDVVPYHCETLDDAEEAFRVATRALIRANQMRCLYQAESDRTNRIGVGITGIHEFAWKFFSVGFREMISPDFEALEREQQTEAGLRLILSDSARSACFWKTLQRFNAAVKDEAARYSKELRVVTPHTLTTIKPSGTVSKLFGLTEGYHLPSMAFYMRWVQFRSDDPLVQTYAKAGYPTRTVRAYEGTTIVGFPTAPLVSTLGMGDRLVTASETTPEEQYKWLQLGEQYWIRGEGVDRGNQISYTLKYHPKRVTYDEFCDTLKKYQPTVRACSVMPYDDDTAYEYLPEQPLTKADYEEAARAVVQSMEEDVDKVHVDCASGACPVDFSKVREAA